MFLLDTCALSELVARRPNPHAVEAIIALPDNEWFIAAATVGEIRRGIDELRDCPRRDFLENWFQEQVVGIYLPKLIVFDAGEATAWGTLVASLRRKRLPMGVADSQIAATALVHGLTIITRNEKDFAHCGCRILNPWLNPSRPSRTNPTISCAESLKSTPGMSNGESAGLTGLTAYSRPSLVTIRTSP